MSSKITACTFVAALAVAAASSAAQTELTTNGGFEAGDISGWTSFPTPATTFFADDTDSKTGAFMGNLENLTTGTAAVIKQANIGVGLVSPGQEINISFWAKSINGVAGVNFAEFFSELEGGGTSKAEILSGGPLFAPSDVWTFYSFTTTAGPNVDGGVTLQLTSTTGAVIGSTSQLFFDDVSVTIASVACEPDINGDGVVDNGDIGVFVNLFLAGDSAADFNGDGILDNGDIGAFVASFLAGC